VRSDRRRNRLKSVWDTFLYGNKNLVPLFQQHFLHTEKIMSNTPNWILVRRVVLDVLVFVNALVKPFDKISYLLAGTEQEYVVINPVNTKKDLRRT